MKLVKTYEDIPIDGYLFNYSLDEEGYTEIYYMIVRSGRVALLTAFFGESIDNAPNTFDGPDPYEDLNFIFHIEDYHDKYIGSDLHDFTWVLSEEEVLMNILAESC